VSRKLPERLTCRRHLRAHHSNRELERRKARTWSTWARLGRDGPARSQAKSGSSSIPSSAQNSNSTKPIKKPKAIWVEPTFVADVEYRDITSEGLLRASSFKGCLVNRSGERTISRSVSRDFPAVLHHSPGAAAVHLTAVL